MKFALICILFVSLRYFWYFLEVFKIKLMLFEPFFTGCSFHLVKSLGNKFLQKVFFNKFKIPFVFQRNIKSYAFRRCTDRSLMKVTRKQCSFFRFFTYTNLFFKVKTNYQNINWKTVWKSSSNRILHVKVSPVVYFVHRFT